MTAWTKGQRYGEPSMPVGPETPASQVQGRERDPAECFGPDHTGPFVTDASNHIAALMDSFEGRPTVAEQMISHHPPPPFTPDVGGHG